VKPDDDDAGDSRSVVVGRWFAESFAVGHNAFEFKVDCGHDESDGEARTVYFRVIASPVNARELFRQLGASLLRYADTFGPIEAPADGRKGDA
jgi:hypothetical protein